MSGARSRPSARQQIVELQVKATKHLEAAVRKLDQIQQLMDEKNITEISGMEVRSLTTAFLKACTQMATANPKTSKRAFEMLRTGEWRL